MNILNKVEGGLIFLKKAMKAYTVKKMNLNFVKNV